MWFPFSVLNCSSNLVTDYSISVWIVPSFLSQFLAQGEKQKAKHVSSVGFFLLPLHSCWVHFYNHKAWKYLSLLEKLYLSQALEESAKGGSWQLPCSSSWQSVLGKCIPSEMDRNINCLLIAQDIQRHGIQESCKKVEELNGTLADNMH